MPIVQPVSAFVFIVRSVKEPAGNGPRELRGQFWMPEALRPASGEWMPGCLALFGELRSCTLFQAGDILAVSSKCENTKDRRTGEPEQGRYMVDRPSMLSVVFEAETPEQEDASAGRGDW